MRYFARFNPLRAFRDLRLFLSHRQKHELWFGILAILVTTVMLTGLLLDSRVEPKVLRPTIQYVESWPVSRTDREIIARQKLDMIADQKIADERRKAQLERQQQFKRLDDKLEAMGL